MRIGRVNHNHRLKERLLMGMIRLFSRRPVPDVVKTLLYRREFFGDHESMFIQSTLRGDSFWTVGERELFAAFTSKLEACHF